MQDRCRQTHTPPGPPRDVRDDARVARPPRVLATRRQFRCLLGATPEAEDELDTDGVLTRVVQAAADLAEAQYGAFVAISSTGVLRPLVLVAGNGRTDDAIGQVSDAHDLLDAIVETGRTVRRNRIRRDATESGSPPGHAPLHSFLGAPVQVDGETCGVLMVTNCRTGAFTPEVAGLVESFAATAGISIRNARRWEESRRRERLSRALSDVDAALLAPQRDGILGVMADRMARIVACDLVTVVVPVDAAHLRIETARGPRSAAYEHAVLPAATSVAARAIETGRVGSGRLTDEATHAELLGIDDASGPTVAVPLVAAGSAVGALCATRAEAGDCFSPAEIDVISEFAAQAGLAISLAWARQDRQHLEIIEERNRVARDLHDNVVQRLFATGMSLQAFAATDPLHADVLEQHVAEIDAAITDIRSGILSLRPRRVKKKDRPTSHRVLDVIAELASALPSSPTITFVGPVDLVVTGTLAGDVIAVVREALANVAHHAHARNCAVTVAVSEREAAVWVQDDGDGLAASRRSAGGTANLAERAALHGGTFTLDGRGEGGTTARWTVPRPAGSDASPGEVTGRGPRRSARG